MFKLSKFSNRCSSNQWLAKCCINVPHAERGKYANRLNFRMSQMLNNFNCGNYSTLFKLHGANKYSQYFPMNENNLSISLSLPSVRHFSLYRQTMSNKHQREAPQHSKPKIDSISEPPTQKPHDEIARAVSSLYVPRHRCQEVTTLF